MDPEERNSNAEESVYCFIRKKNNDFTLSIDNFDVRNCYHPFKRFQEIFECVLCVFFLCANRYHVVVDNMMISDLTVWRGPEVRHNKTEEGVLYYIRKFHSRKYD